MAIIILYGSTFYNVKPHFRQIIKRIYTFTIGSLARGLYSHLQNKYDLVFQFDVIESYYCGNSCKYTFIRMLKLVFRKAVSFQGLVFKVSRIQKGLSATFQAETILYFTVYQVHQKPRQIFFFFFVCLILFLLIYVLLLYLVCIYYCKCVHSSSYFFFYHYSVRHFFVQSQQCKRQSNI